MTRRSASGTRQAAAQVSDAADALLAWLQTRSKPSNPKKQGGGPRAASPGANPASAEATPDPGLRHGPAPQRLAHTDWLYHRLRITGPEST